MILGQKIFDELDVERVICITGVLSGGKTLLAFDFCLPYWRRGYWINSNVPHNFLYRGNAEKGLLYRSFNIIDEGGEYVRRGSMASDIIRSAGKADYYVVFAGKRLPHKNLQDVVIEPRFNFYEVYGIPLILWRATIRAQRQYNVNFFQALPQLLYGTYSTLTSSGSIDKILGMAQATVQDLARREGQVAGQQSESGITGLADDIAETLGAIS